MADKPEPGVWPEVILDDETFRESVTRLSKTLFKSAYDETDHFGWVGTIGPNQTISEHLDDRFTKFLESIEKPESDDDLEADDAN